MSVWYCIPSARPSAEAQRCVDAWRAQGYKVALFRDPGAQPVDCDYLVVDRYPGYAQAVNRLTCDVILMDAAASWLVTGGDDVFPDPLKRAEEIGAECSTHFFARQCCYTRVEFSVWDGRPMEVLQTYGVMQPTGDRWGADPAQPNFAGSAYIDRVAGSPWLGREWCKRAHGGRGPLHPDFFHMFVDEALQGAAIAQGVFWQRPDLTQHHQHWARKVGGAPRPQFLEFVNTQRHWQESKALFERLRADGFRECLPADVAVPA